MSEAAIGKIQAFLDRVWADEPPDIRRLRGTALPPGGRWSGVLFCNLILLWSGQVLALQRKLALEGSVAPAAAAAIVVAELRLMADWLAHWHLDDTCALLRDVADDLASPAEPSAQSLASVIEGLLVAVNRMQNWIDAFVPWARLDQLLPPLDAETAPGYAHR